jgi:hypothetical protein
VTLDGVIYAMTAERNEIVYLNSTTDMDQATNLQSASGCATLVDGGCDEKDIVYFRAENTWFNIFWSLLVNHKMYYAEYAVGAVSSQYQKCILTAYGFRWRFLAAKLNFYPEILEVKHCSPIRGAD